MLHVALTVGWPDFAAPGAWPCRTDDVTTPIVTIDTAILETKVTCASTGRRVEVHRTGHNSPGSLARRVGGGPPARPPPPVPPPPGPAGCPPTPSPSCTGRLGRLI